MTYGLDYETWSRTNLPVRGLANYVADPEFKTLICSVADADGELTYDWIFGTIWKRGNPVNALGHDRDEVSNGLQGWLADANQGPIMAHNAPFEREVTHWWYADFDPFKFEDSAVDARICGAESKLIVASRQLTNSHKLEEGNDLVMLFCVPNEWYPDGPTPELIEKHGHMNKWMRFIEYCEMDAKGSREIRLVAQKLVDQFDPMLLIREAYNEQATWEQNQAGWTVDLPLVKKMKTRAWANGLIEQKKFMDSTGEVINFNSPAQLKKYCEDRGVRVKSLDKYNLPVLLDKVRDDILTTMTEDLKPEGDEPLVMTVSEDTWVWRRDMLGQLSPEAERKVRKLREVQALLECKREMGGSTLSKLPKILDLVSEDGQLRDQYMHCGAGQTLRTTGRGVQMQNIAKLVVDADGNPVREVDSVFDLTTTWTNVDMAGQLRQVFTASEPDGKIIVGDFSAVESRGLAYLAGEEWKLDAYREGKDVYKVLASKYFGVPYEEVTKEQRPRGKYSELSCGYQASASAVQDFMFRLGFKVTLETALEDVSNWRGANPKIVDFWYKLDGLLKDAVRYNEIMEGRIGHDLIVRFSPFELPSMSAQHPGSLSLCIQILLPDGMPFVTRFVHGCYFRGDKLCYYKPAERLNGELWKATYQHPKTKKETYYSIYGGKVAGILTQSLCREMFFDSLADLRFRLRNERNVRIMGQFHDEINADWVPQEACHNEDWVKEQFRQAMTTCRLPDFPLAVDVKSAYRYIK
jgi:hypothetical protein